MSSSTFAVAIGSRALHGFEAGAAIQPDVVQILPEKPETLAEKKDGDERQHDNGDDRVAAEKGLDEIVGAPAANRYRGDYWGRGDDLSHPLIMASWQRWRQMPKCYIYVTSSSVVVPCSALFSVFQHLKSLLRISKVRP